MDHPAAAVAIASLFRRTNHSPCRNSRHLRSRVCLQVLSSPALHSRVCHRSREVHRNNLHRNVDQTESVRG
jgi:hypothetical protein